MKPRHAKVQGSVATWWMGGGVVDQIRRDLLLGRSVNFLIGEYLAKLPARTGLFRALSLSLAVCWPGAKCAWDNDALACKNGKGSPYSITERRVPEQIPVLGSQPAGDVIHRPGGRLPLLSARPAVALATLKRAATSFAVWWTEARWVWTVCLRLLPDSVEAAIRTQALLHLSPAR